MHSSVNASVLVFICCFEHFLGFSDTTSVSLCLGGPPAFTESSSHLADLPAVSPCPGRLYSLQRLVSDQVWPLNLPVLRARILGSIQGAEQGQQLDTGLLSGTGRNINASGKGIPVCCCISERINGHLCL